MLTFENGDKYEGEIQDGKITGKGKRTSLTYIYEGYFLDGKKDGYGKQIWIKNCNDILEVDDKEENNDDNDDSKIDDADEENNDDNDDSKNDD